MTRFDSLREVAAHLRGILQKKKYILLFAYNGTGKTRLSMSFKEYGKQYDKRDTLYFNAFTEDLFYWDNDLEGDCDRVLKLNSNSSFFSGFEELEMDNRIRPFLNRYADFDFKIDTNNWQVRFSREVNNGKTLEYFDSIKVSRGEENMFIWCFFLAVVQLAMDKDIEAYSWVKYIYIDDPISSLDENNAVAVAHHLAQLLKNEKHSLKTVISSHHTLFFNVLCNELKSEKKLVKTLFLSKDKKDETYELKYTGDTPFFYHVAMLVELQQAAESGDLYTYHFNMLRIILEKTASFHGYNGFAHCIKKDNDDKEGLLHTRLINILNHGNYSLYEPQQMLQENKEFFRQILNDFLQNYDFNDEIFSALAEQKQED